MMPLVSVIIPAYNIDRYIGRCLDSVQKQTCKNLEIIVIDDGSTDSTGNLIDEYANLDSRILAIHIDNSGPSKARNCGIDRASGDYIGFVDGDDYIAEDMYELLLSKIEEYNCDIAVCGYEIHSPVKKETYGDSKVTEILKDCTDYTNLMKETLYESLWNKLYKSSLFDNVRLHEDIHNNEDILANFKLFIKAAENSGVVYVNYAKYYYMLRKDSLSNSELVFKKVYDQFIVYDEITDLLVNKNKLMSNFLSRYFAILCGLLEMRRSELSTIDIEAYKIAKNRLRERVGLLKKGNGLRVGLITRGYGLIYIYPAYIIVRRIYELLIQPIRVSIQKKPDSIRAYFHHN